MWIKFNSDGIKISLKITDYSADHNDYPWATTSLYISFDDVIKYSIEHAEILENADLENIRETLFATLSHQLKSPKSIYFAEPDLEFTFKPNFMELRINFWHNGCTTGNGIFISFGKKDMKQLYLYLSLITQEINLTDPRIISLIQNNILYKD